MVGEIVTETVATAPFEMAVVLRPQSTHVELPTLFWHDSCLPAAVAAEPAIMVTVAKSAVEYFIVH